MIVQSSGAPYKWSTASPVPFSVDGGSLGLWGNATAVANVVQAFNRWGPDLSTSALTFSSAGAIPGDGDVNTASEFAALDSGCDGISPVIFDADGSLFAALGMPSSLIGFAGPVCAVGGTLTESLAAFNGKWFDGNLTNGELTEEEFKGLLVHEFGHWLNLDHSQTNGHYFFGDNDPGWTAFGPPPLASVEIMFPFAIGGATSPQKDDIAAVSSLYPAVGFSSSTGTITGTIRYPNGSTPFTGANVIARNVANPYYDAVSNVSGRPYNAPGSVDPLDYEIPGLTDGASYAVEMVNVNANFTAGSSVGPLDPPAVIPAPEEFYNGANEAATNPPDNVSVYTVVPSSGGVVVSGIDIVMNGASADLSVTKGDSPDPAVAGQSLTYTLLITNNGPSAATSVTVTDTLPGGVSFVSATSPGGSCSQASGTVTCGLGSMASGATQTVTIVVTTANSGTLTNTAAVTANESDPNTANNNASATTTVNPGADLSVTQTDAPDPVAVGGQVTYTITVANNGPDAATGVTLTDTLPAGVTFDSATPSQGSCGAPSGGVFTCSLGTFANGSNATVTVIVTTTAAGNIANTASVAATENDSNTANNASVAGTNVGDVSRLGNISTRGFVQTGDNVLIGGVVLRGSTPKTVLVRARGRSLAAFGVVGTMANPYIELFSGSTKIAQNDNWQTTDPLCGAPAVACGTATDIQNTGKSPCSVTSSSCTLDSAILITLPPGPYTVILRGVGGGTGVGIVEVIDLDGTTVPRLVNISTRGLVLTGDNVMIGGFVIGAGAAPKTVLVRVRGPSLAAFGVTGVVANPYVELYSGSTKIAQNDDWQTTDPLCLSPAVSCGNAVDIQNTGKDPCSVTTTGCTLDSAIYVTLPPGPYTAIVRGVGGGTGVGIVEVIDLSP